MADRAEVLRRFEKDVAQHKMTVLRSDGIYRHLRFRKPGCSAYWFDLLTWDDRLCIDGDMGTLVFARTTDMFRFFRNEPGTINPSYWAEKILESGARDGVKEFDPALFIAAAVRDFRDAWRDRLDPCNPDHDYAARRECWDAFRREVLDRAHDGADTAIGAAMDFDGLNLSDFYEHRLDSWTFHYLWMCYAIVWGIQQFDAHVAAAAASEPEVCRG